MKAQITRIGVSLAIVLVAYWTYALCAVPLIEPNASDAKSTTDGAGQALANGRFQQYDA